MSERTERAAIAQDFGSLHNAYEVIVHAVHANPIIESLTLVTYEERLTWRDLRRTDEGTDVPVLLNGLQQDRGERILTKFLRKEVSVANLRDIAEDLGKKNRLLGVISKVCIAGGRWAHIPMMDFMCEPSTRNLEVLMHLLQDLRYGQGCLLESGRSYHYYGFRLLTEEEWRVFLGKCLLMSGYTDDRYIGHQLVDGHCVLRLSSGRLKASVPKVVAELS